jgi:8-oxo-dGTP pyrophosphatase MutT (NUDIX family)
VTPGYDRLGYSLAPITVPESQRVVALRVDNRIEFIILPWSLGRMFSGRYTLRSGKRIYDLRWKEVDYQQLKATQREQPVALVRDGRRTLWAMHDCFYWEDEGLDSDDVKAEAIEDRSTEIAVFLVRRKRSEVLLLHRVPRLGGFWHVISGGIDPGETWEVAAERELLEETGLQFTDVQRCGNTISSYAVPRIGKGPLKAVSAGSVDVRCMLAEVRPDFIPILNWEHDEFRWCSTTDAPLLLRWPNIADALRELLNP